MASMNLLMILNDAPYGGERPYNGLRLAHALRKHDQGGALTVFLMAGPPSAAQAGQKTPEGYYNIELMLKRVLSGGGRVLLCGTCMDARGLRESDVMDGATRSTMDEL